MKNGRILLVEDDAGIASVVTEALHDEGFVVDRSESVAGRDDLLKANCYAVMITDVVLKDGDGLASIERVTSAAPDMPVIVLSAQNTLDTAVRATDSRAFEYFPKPFDLDALVDAVKAALKRDGNSDSGETEPPKETLPLIGRSAAMQDVYRLITRVLHNDLTVLVTGESGTGKELVAEAIHQLGARRTGPFVAVNTAAIPRDLIESELFGHERGAFTGAVAQQIGKFEQANGGTLFLDEIGDMPAEAQVRLLRTLQSARIRRVGGRHEIPVDVRIVAATNRALEPAIEAGVFREDLYYRLNVVPIHLPPLRERKGDIASLANHFLAQAAEEGLPRRKIAEDAIGVLEARAWRGNVRELRNAIFRLVLLSRDEAIDAQIVAEILPVEKPREVSAAGPFTQALDLWLEQSGVADGALYQRALEALEKPLIERILRETQGNQVRTAERLGINRNTLRKKLTELGIAPLDFIERR